MQSKRQIMKFFRVISWVKWFNSGTFRRHLYHRPQGADMDMAAKNKTSSSGARTGINRTDLLFQTISISAH